MIYKACLNSIVTLELLPDSRTNEDRTVYDKRYAKFRTNKARVISIVNPVNLCNIEYDVSIYDDKFIYTVGNVVTSDFDNNIDAVCTNGIHYFTTWEAAVSWFWKNYNIYSLYRKKPEGTYREYNDNGLLFSEYTIDKEGMRCYSMYIDSAGCYSYYRYNKEISWLEYYSNGYICGGIGHVFGAGALFFGAGILLEMKSQGRI